MSGGKDHDEDDPTPSDFRRALDDVEPIDHGRRRPEPTPRLRPPLPEASTPPVAFELDIRGERVEGLAPGADRRLLAMLRRGQPAPGRRIELHGLHAAEAELELAAELRRAYEAGERCVLVIHGRGLHSEGEAVLKTALPGWLAMPPHGPWIRAFATPGPGFGGAGATCVLLARGRPASPGSSSGRKR